MKLWVTLEGHDAEVEFHAQHGSLVLEVEGRRLAADFHRLPDGEVYSLIVNGRSHEVRVAPGPAGAGSVEEVLRSVRRVAAAQAVETIVAPMPGLLVAFRVEPGERVAPGGAVAVVEAMKMQNELVSRHGGIVAELLVDERATVSAGQPLLRLRPEGA